MSSNKKVILNICVDKNDRSVVKCYLKGIRVEFMKEKILLSTLELACEKGLGYVSMSQIAARCGLSKSSLYSHYKSKEEIIHKMYEYFRNKAFNQNRNVDISNFNKNSSFIDVLSTIISSYKSMNSEPDLAMFYKMIYAERTLNKEAARVLVLETNRMIEATKRLFTYTNELGISHINDIDAVAMSFALNVNQIMNYEFDLSFIGENPKSYLDLYIKEFARVYGGN